MSAATPATVTPDARELAAMLRSARGLEENSQTLSMLMASPRLARAVLGLFLVGATIAGAHFSGGRTREIPRDTSGDLAIFHHNAARHPSLSPADGRVRSHTHQEENGMRSLRALVASTVGVGSIMAAGISGSALAQDAVQWRIEDGGNGHWYVLIAHAAEWDTARILAESKGGHLVTLTSAAEALFVRQLGSGTVWLGLRQNPTSPTFAEPAGGWEWITSEPLIYTNWRINENGQPNEPNNIDGTPTDVGTLDAPLATTWNDVPQVAQYPYLIEFDMDCNADGIVDYGQIRAGDLEDTNANNIPDCCEQSLPCERNLLVNGGFEFGPSQTDCTEIGQSTGSAFVPGWSVVAVSVGRVHLSDSCAMELASWRSFEGEFTIDLDGDAAGGAIAQSVVTQPGQRYRLTFQLTGNCAPGIKRMRVEIGSLLQEFEHVCASTNPQPWSKKSIEFEATAKTTTIVLRSLLTDGRNGPVIDDVRLVQLEDPCLADIDESGAVNAVDLAAILSNWGTNGGKYPRADIDGNGDVDGADLAAVLSAWGPCP